MADFGLAEDVYMKGYFRQETDASVRLPYKWMPPESLQDMIFSEKSDVVCIRSCSSPASSANFAACFFKGCLCYSSYTDDQYYT